MARKFQTSITIEDLASAASQALGTKVAADSQFRLAVDAGGKLVWGSGSATGDTNLYRSAANTLKTDDTFVASGGVVTLTSSGAPTATLDDGALAVDTTNDVAYIRSGGAWVEVAGGGGGVTVSDTAPSLPSEGDLWFESDTGRTFVYYVDGSSSQWVEVGAASAGASGSDGYIQFSTGGTFDSDSDLVWNKASGAMTVTGTLEATSGLITMTSAGAPSSSLADGAIAVDTTNDTFYYRSNSQWKEVSGTTITSSTTDAALLIMEIGP